MSVTRALQDHDARDGDLLVDSKDFARRRTTVADERLLARLTRLKGSSKRQGRNSYGSWISP